MDKIMFNEDFKIRQQFIRSNNELNKGVNVNSYIEGNKRRVEQSRKLEELSINSGMNFSGNVIRKNILDSSASDMTTLNNVVDTEIYREEANPNNENNALKKFNSSYASLNNQGKNMINNNMSQNNINSMRNFNNYNNKF